MKHKLKTLLTIPVYLCAFLFVSLVTATFAASSASTKTNDEFDARYLHGIYDAKTFSISPKESEQNYYIYVKLPQNMEANKKYPTVYLLDGGASFPLLAPYYDWQHFTEELPGIILVGISYGSKNWRKGNNRSHDYTVPSKAREHWGGAKKFSQFLRDELFAVIEGKYPSDPKKRILFGNSLAAQFGLYNATFQVDLFYGIIANNPAIHEVTDQFLVESIATSRDNPLKLYVALAENDADRFKVHMHKWQAHWIPAPPPQWQLKIQPMPGHNHFSSMPETFRQGLKWILLAQ